MPRQGRWLLALSACAALYVGASQVGFALAYVDHTVSTVWVPSGLGLAIVLLGGGRMWPAILIGELVANLLHGSSLGASAVMGGGDVLEALTARALLLRVGFRPELDRVRDIFSLLLLGALASTTIGALFGTLSLLLFGSVPLAGSWTTWYTWWLGDASGMIIVAPLIFSFAGRRPHFSRGLHTLEAVAFGSVLVPVLLLALGAPPEVGFLTLPAVIWGTVRFGQRGASLVNAVLATALVIFAQRSNALLHGVSLSDRLLLVQDLLAIAALTTLVLAVAIRERERDANELTALTEVSTAIARDSGADELLALTARAAGSFLGVSELLVTRPAGAGHALVVGGWRADGGELPEGSEAPGDGVHVPVQIHGVNWGELVVAEPAAGSAAVPEDLIETSLRRFSAQLGLGLASAQARDGLIERASTDPLTGLANHRSFHERLTEETARAARHGRPLAVAMIDIDGFKTINDTVGHVAGDSVLATIASRVLEVMRSEATVARLGGDEIGVILPECDLHTACGVLERVRRTVAAAPIGAAGTVRISAGICDNSQVTGAERLREAADAALYWVKSHGRDRVMAFSETMLRDLSESERATRVARSQAALGIRALARAIDAKDPATAQHSEQVAALACAMARERGWTEEQVARLRDAALVHDVGKLAISDEIVSHSQRLSGEQYEEIKRHAELSAQIAAEMLDAEQLQWIRWHHERADGTGYPDALAAAQLPEGAKLLALADAFDTMVSGRSYSPARTHEEAVSECISQTGTQFAPEAVAALIAVHESHALWSQIPQAAPSVYR